MYFCSQCSLNLGRAFAFPSKIGPKIEDRQCKVQNFNPNTFVNEPAIVASSKLMSSGCAEITYTQTQNGHKY